MKEVGFFLILIGTNFCTVSADNNGTANIVEPCDTEIDLACVKKYFRKNGQCSVVADEKDSVTYEDQIPIYFSKVGMTAVTTKISLSQFDSNFKNFYINKTSGNLVITVDFSSKGIFCYEPDCIFAIHQKGKEPKVFTENVNATYPAILTAEIPISDGIITIDALKNAEYSAYFPDSDALIYIGPKFTQSDDSDIKEAYEGLLADITTALKEVMVTKASYFFLVYIQNYICDFGLSPLLRNYDPVVFIREIDAYKNDDTKITEPCAKNEDVRECVRSYFKEQGSCSVVEEPSENPVPRDIFVNEMPYINSSVTLTRVQLSGLDGEIENFYINKQTNNLIMTVAFDYVIMNSSLCHVFIHMLGQSKVVSEYAILKYPITLTAVMPIGEGLTEQALRKAFVSTSFKNLTIFDLGPNFTDTKDPDVIAIVKGVLDDPNAVAKELSVTEGPNFFLAFLQKYICDFGISLSSFQSIV